MFFKGTRIYQIRKLPQVFVHVKVKQTGGWADRQMDVRTDRQKERQTYGRTPYIHRRHCVIIFLVVRLPG